MLIAAQVTGAPLVRLDFAFGLHGALNLPTVIAVIVGGLFFGVVIGVCLARVGTEVAPYMVAMLSSAMLTSLQLSTVIGQAISAPNNTGAYVGGHIGFVILSCLCGSAAGLGVWVWQQYREPSGSPAVLRE